MPVLLPELGAENRRARAVARLHELEREAPEQLAGAVEQPLVQHEHLEGGVLAGELALAARSLARLAPRLLEVGAAYVAGAHPSLAGGLASAQARWVFPVPVGPWSTTFWPRSANPQVESSVTSSRSSPRSSEKSMERTSASG